MGPIRYYSSVFIRRLPYFLIVATVVSAVAIIIAITLPPTYVSQMRLIVEAPQIPTAMATSTVNTPAEEQLQIVEQRLLTRPVLLDISRKHEVIKDQAEASPDRIVEALRAQTRIRISAGRGQATLMVITFEAPSGAAAGGVLNEYLTEIQNLDVSYRKERASGTLEFFEQEVERLSNELDLRSGRILEFKEENAGALPESLQFRLAQQGALQTNLEQTDQQIFSLQSQREKLMEIYTSTGQVVGVAQQNLTPSQQQLDQLQRQLSNDRAIYSETNPRITLLQARIEQLQEVVAAEQVTSSGQAAAQTGNSSLNLQLAQIDSQIETLADQRIVIAERLAKLTATIDQTPANAIILAELQRDHDNIQMQYNAAVSRLAQASTGERIEVSSQGQRISVIEYPTVPSAPDKPNRLVIAGGGTFFGIALGAGLVLLMEVLNKTARRPEDLIRKLEVWPIATIPYVQSRGEAMAKRAGWMTVVLIILIGIPVGVWAVHTFYQPLDLIAERVMDKLRVY
jgi:polysaccharide chain length determinant protein (PEP-CTERM system associated)